MLHRYLNLILHKYYLDKSFGFKEIKPVFLPSMSNTGNVVRNLNITITKTVRI